MNYLKSKAAILATALLICLGAPSAALAKSGTEYSGDMKDAWLHGKVETAFALNPHLNPFSIDTDVQDGMVLLYGKVESDIDRDLASQIAKSVEGVKGVKNKLVVATEPDGTMSEKSDVAQATENFMQKVSDATTTAVVKTKLLANNNTKGLAVNVDTHNDVVTLSGKVESDEIRDLAGAIAENTDNVERVDNRLEIVKKS